MLVVIMTATPPDQHQPLVYVGLLVAVVGGTVTKNTIMAHQYVLPSFAYGLVKLVSPPLN